jgi:N-acetylmuramoyl-L-alanine amidase/putative methionine-R-sulfoxide reductase with GAF domain
MSASPKNAGLELIPELPVVSPVAAVESSAGSVRPSREALQALLAFSSLHEQIRQRREQEKRLGAGFTAGDVWQLEQFVLDEVLQLVAERAQAITGADGVAIALAEGDAIVCRASAGNVAPDTGMRLNPCSGFSGECLVSGQVVRCDDSELDPRVDVLACRRLGARSMVAVPLSAKGNVIGLLEAFSSEPHGLNDSDVRSLSLLAELILSAMKPEEEDRLAEISQQIVVRPDVPKIEAQPPQAGNKQESESTQHNADIEEPSRSAGPVSEYDAVERSRPGLAVVIVVVLLALGLGVGIWWSIRTKAGSVTAVKQQRPSTVPAPPSPAPTPVAMSTQPTTEDESIPDAGPVLEAGVLPQVSGIRHWSAGDSSTVAVDLQDQVQYEAHRLGNPDRIYFDLHDTRLAAGLNNKAIDVEDALLQRIRVAQPFPGVTRVVLETKGASNFSVSLEPNPFRLVIEVYKPGAKPHQRARIDLFGSGNQANVSQDLQAAQPSATLTQPPGNIKDGVRSPVPALRIALDAGHGGWDLGTVGRGGLLEKDVVLDIVDRLGELIQSRLGAEVIYTRKSDDYVALEKRAEIANLANADLFVSVHANYSDYASARGVETYYTNTYSSLRARPRDEAESSPSLQNVNWTNVDIREKVHDSHLLAGSVQRSLYSTLAAKNPGLPNRGVKEAQYVVLTGTFMPAILAEVSFLSSSADENNLQNASYRQKIAEALYQGMAHFVEEKAKPVKMARAPAKPARQ